MQDTKLLKTKKQRNKKTSLPLITIYQVSYSVTFVRLSMGGQWCLFSSGHTETELQWCLKHGWKYQGIPWLPQQCIMMSVTSSASLDLRLDRLF